MGIVDTATDPIGLGGVVRGTRSLVASGVLRPVRPDRLVRAAAALVRDGISPAAAYGLGAARFPGELALVDDRGTLTFDEASHRIAGLASSLAGTGVGRGDRVGLLCRNGRGFVLAAAALSSLGADVVLLNVSSSTEEIGAALDGQGSTLLVHDDVFDDRLQALPPGIRRLVVAHDTAEGPTPSIDDLGTGADRRHRMARYPGSRFVLLSSGTTGVPRGTSRPVPLSLDPLAALLLRIPLRARDTTLIASPLFHAWGFSQLGLGMFLSSTVVLQAEFDPEAALAAVARHRVRVLVAVPVMLQRLVELPAGTFRRYDTSSLEVVASSGSALPGDLALRFMDRFGDVLYNIYGSTEAAWASIAGPADLRADPRTAGRPPPATALRIVADDGTPLPAGEVGRIVVRNSLTVPDGAPGRHRPVPDGFVATGDLGHVDAGGLLVVDGREDDMIVSGGENVYPQEVEDLLSRHPAILEAVVIGVSDEEFGQRLRAVVVPRVPGAITDDAVRTYVHDHLSRFKVPRDVVFVYALPRTATGKPLHRVHAEDGGAPTGAQVSNP